MSRPTGPTAMHCKVCDTFNGKHAAGCSVGFPPQLDPLEVLRNKIAMMREMGVLEADGIKLGPPPQPEKKEETKEEWEARQLALRQRQHDIMFAATPIKPAMRLVKK